MDKREYIKLLNDFVDYYLDEIIIKFTNQDEEWLSNICNEYYGFVENNFYKREIEEDILEYYKSLNYKKNIINKQYNKKHFWRRESGSNYYKHISDWIKINEDNFHTMNLKWNNQTNKTWYDFICINEYCFIKNNLSGEKYNGNNITSKRRNKNLFLSTHHRDEMRKHLPINLSNFRYNTIRYRKHHQKERMVYVDRVSHLLFHIIDQYLRGYKTSKNVNLNLYYNIKDFVDNYELIQQQYKDDVYVSLNYKDIMNPESIHYNSDLICFLQTTDEMKYIYDTYPYEFLVKVLELTEKVWDSIDTIIKDKQHKDNLIEYKEIWNIVLSNWNKSTLMDKSKHYPNNWYEYTINNPIFVKVLKDLIDIYQVENVIINQENDKTTITYQPGKINRIIYNYLMYINHIETVKNERFPENS